MALEKRIVKEIYRRRAKSLRSKPALSIVGLKNIRRELLADRHNPYLRISLVVHPP